MLRQYSNKRVIYFVVAETLLTNYYIFTVGTPNQKSWMFSNINTATLEFRQYCNKRVIFFFLLQKNYYNYMYTVATPRQKSWMFCWQTFRFGNTAAKKLYYLLQKHYDKIFRFLPRLQKNFSVADVVYYKMMITLWIS